MKVTVNYGLTVPGPVEYSSERFSISLEQEISDGTIEPEFVAAELATQAKLAVINQAGASAATDENGVIRPVLAPRGAATPPAPVVPISAAPSYGPGPYNPEVDGPPFDAGQASAPQPQPQQPAPQGGKIDTLWDNRPVTIYDNRAKKVAPGVTPNKEAGEYAANAADFKIKFNDVGDQAPPDVKYQSVWLKKRGSTEFTQAGLAIANLFGG